MRNSIYLNRPIQSNGADWIGISTYVEKLEEAVNAEAKLIAITSDFGAGKSSLISLYKNIHKEKKIICLNMWSDYAHLTCESSCEESELGENKPENGDVTIVPIELHKAFLYQVVSQIDTEKIQKSNYISRRLSENFVTLSIIGKNKWVSVIATLLLVAAILSTVGNGWIKRVLEYFLFELKEDTFSIMMLLLFVASIVSLLFVFEKSEIIFSSRKSEGAQTIDENILISLFKQEVLNSPGNEDFVIVIEDLDRIDDKDAVLQFMRELRKYYIVEGGKHKIAFIVCIKPEAMLKDASSDKGNEYKKIFDYIINLQKINIDNFDTILNGLLKEKADYIKSLGLKPESNTPGMDWIIYGRDIDIREVKNRLNEALTLYESLLSRFPGDETKPTIEFEKCAVATYLRRNYEADLYNLPDDALDYLISHYVIRKEETMENYWFKDEWGKLSEDFRDEVTALAKDKRIDENYRVYFYNYPKGSRLFTISEKRVYDSIVYKEEPKNPEEYLGHLMQVSNDIIGEAYDKVSALGISMPEFVFSYDKLFALLYNTKKDKFFEVLRIQDFDKRNQESVCELVKDCVRERGEGYNRRQLIEELSKRLNEGVNNKFLLCEIRQTMCRTAPEYVKEMASLFSGNNQFITPEETDLISDLDSLLELANYKMMNQDSDLMRIHKKILRDKKWNQEKVEFYKQAANRQGMAIWKEPLSEACAHFSEIPEDIVAIYENAIKTKKIEMEDYILCLDNVVSLGERQLQPLANDQWVNGLSEKLCVALYRNEFYLEYICNAALTDASSLYFDDENIVSTIEENADWIEANAPMSFEAIRKLALNTHSSIEKLEFLFKKPYAILSQKEIMLIKKVEDAIRLLEGRALTEEQSLYILSYFNREYRNPKAFYGIISFVLEQAASIAKQMFYGLDFSHNSYVRMKKAYKEEVRGKAFTIFGMQDDPREKIRFLRVTGEPAKELEEGLLETLNRDAECKREYLLYANKLEAVPAYTIKNISRLTPIDVYSPAINEKLWKEKEYETYVSSKVALEKKFVVEEDKRDVLWPIYVEMFNSSVRKRTREYMIKNEEFIQQLIEDEEYLKADKNSIVNYAVGLQTVELLNYVVEEYDEETQLLYFKSTKGFIDENAARRFCQIAKANPTIGTNEDVYNNIKGTLVSPGLEGWFTKIRNQSK